MMVMWLYSVDQKGDWLYFTAIGAVGGGCVLHITFQLIYYKTCHPKASEIKFFLHPTQQYNCYQSVCHTLEEEDQNIQLTSVNALCKHQEIA